MIYFLKYILMYNLYFKNYNLCESYVLKKIGIL